MEYVEILRARRMLFWFGIVLLGMVALTAVSIYGGHAEVQRGTGAVLLSKLVGGAVFGALVVATFMATGLNAEFATTAIAWTRPKTREAIAWLESEE